MSRRVLAGGCTAVVAAFAAGCGGVDDDKLEGDISKLVRDYTGTKIDVQCPSGRSPDPGQRITCTSKVDGKPYEVVVEFLRDRKFRIVRAEPK